MLNIFKLAFQYLPLICFIQFVRAYSPSETPCGVSEFSPRVAPRSFDHSLSKADFELDLKQQKGLSSFRMQFFTFMENPEIRKPFRSLLDELARIHTGKPSIFASLPFLCPGSRRTGKLDYMFFPSPTLDSRSQDQGRYFDDSFLKALQQIEGVISAENKLLVLLRFFSIGSDNQFGNFVKYDAAYITFFIPFIQETNAVLPEKYVYTTSFGFSYTRSSLKLQSSPVPWEKMYDFLQQSRNTQLSKALNHEKCKEGFFVLDMPSVVPFEFPKSVDTKLSREKIAGILSLLHEIYAITEPKIGTLIPSPLEEELKFQACFAPPETTKFRRRTSSFNGLELYLEQKWVNALSKIPPGKLQKTLLVLQDSYNIAAKNSISRTVSNNDSLHTGNKAKSKKIPRRRVYSVNVLHPEERLTQDLEEVAANCAVAVVSEHQELPFLKEEIEIQEICFLYAPIQSLPEVSENEDEKANNEPVALGCIENRPSLPLPRGTARGFVSVVTLSLNVFPRASLFGSKRRIKGFKDDVFAKTSMPPVKLDPCSFLKFFEVSYHVRKEKPLSSLLHQRLNEGGGAKKACDQLVETKNTQDSIGGWVSLLKQLLRHVKAFWR